MTKRTAGDEPEPCCPKCAGVTGYHGRMTETHKMAGRWGESPEATDSGFNVVWSMMQCSDCGAPFRLNTCEKVKR